MRVAGLCGRGVYKGVKGLHRDDWTTLCSESSRRLLFIGDVLFSLYSCSLCLCCYVSAYPFVHLTLCIQVPVHFSLTHARIHSLTRALSLPHTHTHTHTLKHIYIYTDIYYTLTCANTRSDARDEVVSWRRADQFLDSHTHTHSNIYI